jgi:hypothetical protein
MGDDFAGGMKPWVVAGRSPDEHLNRSAASLILGPSGNGALAMRFRVVEEPEFEMVRSLARGVPCGEPGSGGAEVNSSCSDGTVFPSILENTCLT